MVQNEIFSAVHMYVITSHTPSTPQCRKCWKYTEFTHLMQYVTYKPSEIRTRGHNHSILPTNLFCGPLTREFPRDSPPSPHIMDTCIPAIASYITYIIIVQQHSLCHTVSIRATPFPCDEPDEAYCSGMGEGLGRLQFCFKVTTW